MHKDHASRNRVLGYVIMLFAFAFGAACSNLLSKVIAYHACWLVCVALLVAYVLMRVLKENECLVWKNNYFEVYSQKVDNEFILKNRNKDYLIVSVIEGNIKIDEEELTLGDSFIITSLCENLNIEGNGRIIITKSLI